METSQKIHIQTMFEFWYKWNMLMIQIQKCEKQEILTFRISSEPHLQWKIHFHKNLLLFNVYADFEVDNDFDNSNVGNETTNIYKQSPVCNGI